MIQIGIVILISVFVIKELISFKTRKDDFSKSTDELRKEFKRRDIVLIILFPLLLVAVTIGLTSFLNFLSDWSIQNDSEIIYIIKPDMGTWIGMAMISTLGYSIFVLFKLAQWIFKSKEPDYWIYYNRKYGFKATNFLKFVGILSLTVGSIWICLNLNSYTKFKDDKIEIKQFGSFQKVEYEFATISKIIHYQKIIAPNDSIVERPHYMIVFDDNFKWKTNDEFRTPKNSDEQFINLIKAKTGLEIEEQEIDQ